VKKEKKYHGVVVPMITPFTKKGNLDESATIKISHHLVNGGAFPFLLGTNGESASISKEKRLKLVKSVVAEVKNKSVIYAGISDNCLENSIAYANLFFDLGVDALVAHLPSYFPLEAEEMFVYYENLADKSPGPIMIYNIPSTTHMSIPLEIIEKLSHHPNIIGLKDSERDLDRIDRAAKLFSNREDFSLFCGWTAQSAKTLIMGFDGIVPSTGNVIPQLFKELYDAAFEQNVYRASELQQKVDEIASIHQAGKKLTQTISALKLMVSKMKLCEPYILPPLSDLNPIDQKIIIQNMTKFGLIS